MKRLLSCVALAAALLCTTEAVAQYGNFGYNTPYGGWYTPYGSRTYFPQTYNYPNYNYSYRYNYGAYPSYSYRYSYGSPSYGQSYNYGYPSYGYGNYGYPQRGFSLRLGF